MAKTFGPTSATGGPENIDATGRRTVKRGSSARRVADAIRRDAMERSEGERLGSEDDLILRYGVSRPTLRLAAALVVQDNLLVVKRGVGGGYFVRRPDSKVVAHMAAVYLSSRRTAVEEVVGAMAPLWIELAKLAAASGDERERAGLEPVMEASIVPDASLGEFVRAEREFGRWISKLGGNKVISLFLEILYGCGAQLFSREDPYNSRPYQIGDYRDKRDRLMAAVLEGDKEVAVLTATRLASTLTEWMMRDLKHLEPTEQLVALPGCVNRTLGCSARSEH